MSLQKICASRREERCPPDGAQTVWSPHHKVSQWLESIDRPNGLEFLDLGATVIGILIKRLDINTRSNFEKTCKSLLHLSRRCKPRLFELTINFTTTWNLEEIVEVTAKFSASHVFHAAFLCDPTDPGWMIGGWSTEKRGSVSCGMFPSEKLSPEDTFVKRTSRYVEYWLRNFQFDVLKVKVENLVPGKERSIQQMNYEGGLPALRVKRFVLQGANNLSFILNWLNALVPLKRSGMKGKTDVELIDVAKLDLIFNCDLITNGDINFKFHKNAALLYRKTLSYINGPSIELSARTISSEAVNVFLKRWTHRDMTDHFRLLTIRETTSWNAQMMSIGDILKGVRHHQVTIETEVDLKVLQFSAHLDPKIFRIQGHRLAFCVLCANQFVFEVPALSEIPHIKVSSQKYSEDDYEDYDRWQHRLYIDLFRRRILRFHL